MRKKVRGKAAVSESGGLHSGGRIMELYAG